MYKVIGRDSMKGGNHNTIHFVRLETETCYHAETPEEVREAIERLVHLDRRVRLFWGYRKTGKCWNEENDVCGTISRSTGSIKVPILINNSRSMGGGALLDHCILKIVETRTGRVIYQAKNFKQPTTRIEPSKEKGYTHSLFIDNTLYANCR